MATVNLNEIFSVIARTLKRQDATITAYQKEVDGLTAERDALRTKLEEVMSDVEIDEDLLAEIKQYLPDEDETITDEEREALAQNDSNPTQGADEVIQAIADDPATPVEASEIAELGTDEPTPEDELDNALTAVAQSVSDEESSSMPEPETAEASEGTSSGLFAEQ